MADTNARAKVEEARWAVRIPPRTLSASRWQMLVGVLLAEVDRLASTPTAALCHTCASAIPVAQPAHNAPEAAPPPDSTQQPTAGPRLSVQPDTARQAEAEAEWKRVGEAKVAELASVREERDRLREALDAITALRERWEHANTDDPFDTTEGFWDAVETADSALRREASS